MPTIKIKIARFLIISGFLLNMGNYVLDVFNFYQGDKVSITTTMDDTEEKSESKEKDNSENEDVKEKDKISQYTDAKYNSMATLFFKDYPDVYYGKSSVYLEYTTPPPENS